ncbi:ABC transporter permease [Clostridium aestuarii]|uniref:ABC transporter permease n=1 Tax=Clostridium aestuarii TaxID=338193 RepID=A0ABT4D380_9CLOT|nr:ABC transporter permease [Clostridium aestuarii]MCY6485107.1 ABC transporter permease [Clostridium aestuarii]
MKKLKGSIVPILILILWWSGSKFNMFNSYIIPAPERVVQTAWNLIKKGLLIKHLGVSLYRVFIGFCITFVIAFPLAIIVGMKKKVYEYLEPILEFIRHIPPIALIPMLILWFGIGEISKISVIVLATFFPVFLNTLNGVMNCDGKLIEVGKVFDFNKKQEFFKIILPQAMPSIIVGMQLGLGYSWRSLVAAELIAASTGIGYMINDAEQLSRPDIIIVGIFTIGIVGCCVDYIFIKITNIFIHIDRRKANYGGSENKEFI